MKRHRGALEALGQFVDQEIRRALRRVGRIEMNDALGLIR